MAILPILMYHNICDTESNKLTVSVQNLEQQLQYLKNNNYTTFHFSELQRMKSIPKKSIVLTFDDATENQLIFAIPLLEKFNFKASFFIPFFYIGKTDLWINGYGFSKKKIMTIEQLKGLNSNRIELGYHSYEHKKYSLLSAIEIQNDFLKCEKIIEDNGLKIYPVLAYPYGNYPKAGNRKENFKQILISNRIKLGLRIGNRPNRFPFKDDYEIKRIDIKGQDSLLIFKLKIRFGKLNLF
ncbi:polysaccharide deacetylase family protein [Flavobacterium humidisoli]|uniref:Polysaccharide deacetylase family protein n=1 Tax=Flavobacterium humidisoli TaxID=2937442 RepID=A0ABY4LY06_9FLAO|nr:polysaccharide deacetylase family protein [Flavobacterium humidisoli]UPZ17963.1 polysaccharide deacetylase family protein [Flavobacterium humidisoli]